MSQTQNAVPLLIPFKETQDTRAIHLTEDVAKSLGIPIATNLQVRLEHPPQQLGLIENSNVQFVEETPDNQLFVYEVVYPEDLNLKPLYNVKRGRPKKKKLPKENINELPEVPADPPPPPKTARTRSGRLVKLPKHIEKDFKKIEINDEPEVKTTEFVRFEETKTTTNNKLKELEYHQRKRVVSSQYRCPKCKKNYLGKSKMMDHLKKFPDHGPLPEGLTELNFDVWNYLVDITQKCPPGKRGIKFCEELTNLLHNVQLLTSALFKMFDNSKNCVQIDKVLGNAIGLAPGNYKFDENELYKDVTVLKLITNSDFFNTSKTTPSNTPNYKQDPEIDVGTNSDNKINDHQMVEHKVELPKTIEKNVFFPENITTTNSNIDFHTENMLHDGFINNSVPFKEYSESNNKKHSDQEPIYKFNTKSHNHVNDTTYNKSIINDNTEPDHATNYNKKIDHPSVENPITLHNDLLSDTSILNSLPHNTVDDLMLSGVDTSSNMLDNSTSSDEVMNVDQFVNERFKKITEPDIEMSTNSLNLDLPTLDLFQFHTS